MAQPHLRRLVVSTASLPSSIAFYRDIVGAQLVGEQPPIATLDVGGTELMLHERPAHPTDAGFSPVFGIEHLDDRVRGWQSSGGTVIDPPEDQPWGERMAVVRDPDGHVVCLVQD